MLYEALSIKCYLDIFKREFLRPGDDRLLAFEQNPKAYGPRLRNTRLHLSGVTTKELAASKWNRELTFKLARSAEYITSHCPDRGRFGGGEIDWDDLMKTRMYELYKCVCRAQMRPGESPEDARERFITTYLQENKRKKLVTLREAVR